MTTDNEEWVLVKYPSLARTPYNVIPEEHWNVYSQSLTNYNRRDGWEEVARGTEDEMRALGRLMPDPKGLNYD